MTNLHEGYRLTDLIKNVWFKRYGAIKWGPWQSRTFSVDSISTSTDKNISIEGNFQSPTHNSKPTNWDPI